MRTRTLHWTAHRSFSVEFLLTVLLLSSTPTTTRAFTPIHPDASNVEEMQQWHAESRRMAPIATDFIHPQICHDVGADECELMEDEFRANARRLKDIVHSTGEVNVLVLLVRFSDHETRKLPKRGEYSTLFNSIGESTERVPSGSVHEYLMSQSYGELNLKAHVEDWRTTNNTEAFFSEGKHGVSHKLRFMMYPVLDAMDAEGFDFSKFDSNNDGLIDAIFLLTSSYPSEVGGIDCYGQDFPNRIWAHAIAHPSFQWQSTVSGIKANGYAVSSALRGICGSVPLGMAVLMHEFGHLLELPDLRQPDAQGPTEGQWIGFGTGHFDVMSDGHGLGGGSYPSSYSPWSKLQIGWLRPTEITKDGKYSIEAYQDANDVYIIKEGFPEGEFLLIENRQPVLWDRHMWSGGILIWHIDEHKGSLFQRDRGHPGQEGWPGNGRHNRVALMQADGKYDLEEGKNQGHDVDFWHADSILQELGPGPARDEAIEKEYWMYPNTDTYQDGIVTSTGIRIFGFSPSRSVMTFKVAGLSDPTDQPSASPLSPTDQPTTSRPSLAPTLRPTPAPTEMPTISPSRSPSENPSTEPSWAPSLTLEPSQVPSMEPTTAMPSTIPSLNPSLQPSTLAPTMAGEAFDQTLTMIPTTEAATATFVPMSGGASTSQRLLQSGVAGLSIALSILLL